jgi:membrane protease YdiL (CAAX protease family)
VQIFFIGLFFGWARWLSGSSLLTILLHALTNLWATLQSMAAVDGWFKKSAELTLQ